MFAPLEKLFTPKAHVEIPVKELERVSSCTCPRQSEFQINDIVKAWHRLSWTVAKTPSGGCYISEFARAANVLQDFAVTMMNDRRGDIVRVSPKRFDALAGMQQTFEKSARAFTEHADEIYPQSHYYGPIAPEDRLHEVMSVFVRKFPAFTQSAIRRAAPTGAATAPAARYAFPA